MQVQVGHDPVAFAVMEVHLIKVNLALGHP